MVAAANAARLSLLDVVRQRQRDTPASAKSIARCIYVARRFPDRVAACALEDMFKDTLEASCGSAKFTGLLVQCPRCLLHVLEVDSDKMMSCLHSLQSAGDTAQLQGSRVVYYTDCVSVQLFSHWHRGSLNRDCKDQHEGLEQTILMQAVKAISSGCQKSSKQLELLNEGQPITAYGALQQELLHPWCLPETVLAMTYTQDLPTIEEFLAIFDGVISSRTTSEAVWPATSVQFPRL